MLANCTALRAASSKSSTEIIRSPLVAINFLASSTRVPCNLTIKGITYPQRFDATLYVHGKELTAKGKMVIDRTKYDMKFRSGNFFKNLGDTLIYNDFELNVSITAKAATEAVLA